MAKVNLKGVWKIAGVRVDEELEGQLYRTRYVLRSDRCVLRATQCKSEYGNYWGSLNYSVIGRVKDLSTFDLLTYVAKRYPSATSITEDKA